MYQTRAHQPQIEAAQSLGSNPYASFQPSQQPPQYQQPPTRSPQASQSPVSEDGFKPSLPSISNLLGIADGDRGSHDSSSQQAQTQNQRSQREEQEHQQTQAHHEQSYPQAAQPISHAVAVDSRQRRMDPPSSFSSSLSSSQRTIIPPTPPLRSDSIAENTHSPSTISTGSSLSGQPYFLGSGLNNVEADTQRAAIAQQLMKRHSIPSQPNTSPYGTSPYQTSPYTASPGAMSNGSYYSPQNPAYAASGLYQQRPLPSNFPPPAPMPQSAQSTPNLPTTNPWEHHHYISPSSQATFPQSQDRYICQTCNKAFSRPSSLKIHSHSHTGEKPFKCPHAGCGKAFSVRSNMKRHERGCHTGNGMGGDHLD